MSRTTKKISQPDKQVLINQFFDAIHLTMLHYGLWFRETEHQLGLEEAIASDAIVWDKVLDTTLKRIAEGLKIPLVKGVPKVLFNLSKEELTELTGEMSKNWVACDGFWFQHIEQNYDYQMFTTKRINDTNWVRFSQIEAKMIMRRFNLPENGGLPVLKEALQHRQYARICKYTIEDFPDKLTLKINECRIQDARKRHGLADYNCKSSGIAEFIWFAKGIDPRIKVSCIACPPDSHPKEWWCGWEFTVVKA
jgi:hypothetical protein